MIFPFGLRSYFGPTLFSALMRASSGPQVAAFLLVKYFPWGKERKKSGFFYNQEVKEDDQVKIILELQDISLDEVDIARAILVAPETIRAVLGGRQALGLMEEGRLLSLLHISRRLKKSMSKKDIAPWLRQKNSQLSSRSPIDLLGPEVEVLLSAMQKTSA